MNLFELRINSSELFEATLIDDSVRLIEEKPVNVWIEGESLYLAQDSTVTTLENIQSADKTAVHARLYIQQHNLLWSLVKQETDALWLMATPLKDEIVRVDGEILILVSVNTSLSNSKTKDILEIMTSI